MTSLFNSHTWEGPGQEVKLGPPLSQSISLTGKAQSLPGEPCGASFLRDRQTDRRDRQTDVTG